MTTNLISYETNNTLRPATDAEIVASRDAGPTGVIRVEVDGAEVTAYVGGVGRYVVIDDQEYYVDTVEEIEAAEQLLADLGIGSAVVYVGDGPDAVETSATIFAAD
jgi:hypothetical protein